MSIEWVRQFCMSLPHVTEHIQWEDDLVFKIGGKMIAVVRLNAGPYCMSIKADAEEFAELVETPGIAPAPYLARAQWVAFESYSAVPRLETERLLRRSYELVFAKLPKTAQVELAKAKTPKAQAKLKRNVKAGGPVRAEAPVKTKIAKAKTAAKKHR